MQLITFKCMNITILALGTNITLDGLKVGDFVQAIDVPSAQLSTAGRYILANYTNTGDSALSSNGSATLIHRTNYGQETAVSTTDGGQTWTTINISANGVSF